jgi:hypothetical protein
MFSHHMQIRRYSSEIKTLLDNLDLDPLEKNYWLNLNIDLQVVVKDPLDPAQIAEYLTLRNRAVGMGFRIYPAFRTQPLVNFQFSDYISSAFWQVNAQHLTALAALRLPEDPWLGIDMENYDGANTPEPTSSALMQRQYAVAQIRAAMQPFIDALRATHASVAVYPINTESGEDLLYVAESLGRKRVELWTESTFNNSEFYRQSSERLWGNATEKFLALMGTIQSRFPGYLIRPGIYDLERVWTEPYRRNLFRSGPAAPWGFDRTRADKPKFGTTEHRAGTTLSDLNRVRHIWPIQPLKENVPAEFDTTLTATPTPLDSVVDLVIRPAGATRHIDGIQFNTPPQPYTWAGLRGKSVLPNQPDMAFTVDATFRLPIGQIGSCPLFGAVSNNIGIWQVAYDSILDKISLYVSAGRRTQTFDIIMAPPRSQDIRVQVGRNGNVWLHHHSGAAAYQTSNTVERAGVYDSLIIGAGQSVATFPQNNTLVGCPGIVLVKTWIIYDRLLSYPELVALNAGSWPYGYGT